MHRIAGAGFGVVFGLLIAAVMGFSVPDAGTADDSLGEVVVELRVWQDVNDQENLHVSARLQGGRWAAHGTRPVQLQDDSSMLGRYRYDTVSVGGVELGIWQRRPRVSGVRVRIEPNYIGYEYEPAGVTDGEQDTALLPIFVRACGEGCPRFLFWQELGAVPLLLDDGHSPSGRYRYGDITMAVSPTPGLLADREFLLALRDPLAGSGALNWSAGNPVSQWEGVTVEGSPPRVTELRLSGLGLSGEMWGWLGNLTELREIWVDGNPLAGGIPSKLVTLEKLTHLYLGGFLVGCVPPPLLAVPNNNLDQVSLRPCPSVPRVSRPWDAEGFVFRGAGEVLGAVGGFEAGGAGIYRWDVYPPAGGGTIFDVPLRAWLTVGYWEDDFLAGDWEGPGPGMYYGTCLENPTVSAIVLADYVSRAWVIYYHPLVSPYLTGNECQRHIPAGLPQYEALFDQFTASLWRSRGAPW